MGYVFINVIYQIRHVWQDQVYDWYLKWYKVSITLISVDRYEAIWSSNNWHWSVLKHPPIRILDIKYLSNPSMRMIPVGYFEGTWNRNNVFIEESPCLQKKVFSSLLFLHGLFHYHIHSHYFELYHNFYIIECKAASDLILIGKLKWKFIHSIKIWICLPK